MKYIEQRFTFIGFQFLLINFFILDLLSSIISTQRIIYEIIKILFGLILWILILVDYKINKPNIKNHIGSINFKKLIAILLFFILILSVSLLYSRNTGYGIFKLFNFLIGAVPVLFGFYYLLITINRSRINIFFISVIIESIIFLILILLINPFHYDGQKIITLTRWSHVIFEHFIGPLYFLFFFMLIKSRDKRELLFYSAGLTISIIGVYISGARAAFTGLIFFTPLILLLSLWKKELNSKNSIFFFTAIIFSIFIIYVLQPYSETVNSRYISLFDISKPDIGDASVNARITGLEISQEIFKKHPFTGVGFGGYKNYKGIHLTYLIEYPHNIFVEFLIELGIPGLIYFLFLLYIIFISTKRISLFMTIFFCFALWLALFSKSISSNTLLWLGLAFYGLDDSAVKKLKTLFKDNE